MYYICNAKVLTPNMIENKIVAVEGKSIVGVFDRIDIPENAGVIDAKGMYLSPGFIDIHVHGGGGYSAMSGKSEDVVKMCEAHAVHGTTSILPTTLTSPVPKLLSAIDAIREAQSHCTQANILGVHLEGPFLAPSQKGAQSEDCIVAPDMEKLDVLLNHWQGGVKIMGVAPEVKGALDVGTKLKEKGILASIAHSDATYDEVLRAIEAGFSDVTHLYSGCSSVIRKNGYRVAGVVEAGLCEDDLTVQVIADLRHLPVHLLKLIYKCKGADKISLISDGLEYAASNLEEGTVYKQENGIETVFEDHVMKLIDRQAFAGSVATSRELVYNMYKYVGVSLLDSVKMATLTPAKCVGIDDHKGRIAKGYDADLLIFDDELNIHMRMVGGKVL